MYSYYNDHYDWENPWRFQQYILYAYTACAVPQKMILTVLLIFDLDLK